MKILRYYNPHGTVGYCPEPDLWTIERPWLNNQKGESCIPEGRYYLEWHEPTGVTLPDGWTGTWALVNRSLGVVHYPEPGAQRNLILLHVANWPENVEGCIGFGEQHVISGNGLMVTRSKASTAKALEYIRDNQVAYIDIEAWRP